MTSKVRVVINGKFLRADMTGVHRVALELANALADLVAEDHPAVATFAFEVWHPHGGAKAAARVRLPSRSLGPLTGIAWEQLTLPLAKRDAVLLNLCNIAPMLSRRSITMIHDAQVHMTPESYRLGFRLWYRLVQPVIGRRGISLLTVSDFSRRAISNAGIAASDRIDVVHNGVDHFDVVVAAHDIGALLGLERRAFVLALANTQSHKNVALLLRAFARPELMNVSLVLFGGATRDDFEACGSVVPPNTIFAGRVSDAQLKGLMAEALCLAFPSRTEGFGLPPMEAMRSGCAVLAAPCGALPEICGDAAEWLDPDDPAAWANAIVQLIDAPSPRVDLIARGHRRAASFTWRNAALTLAESLSRRLGERVR